MITYESAIKLGDRYRDTVTGYEGAASSVVFYPHGPERVCLVSSTPEHGVRSEWFDAPAVALIGMTA